MMTTTAVLLALAVSGHSIPHSTNDGAWKDTNGKPAPNTEFRKSVKGFGGWLLVTPDQDWEEKWNTPSVVTPRFNEADTVKMGGRIFVLIFFANPALGPDGTATVLCDLEVERPNKTYSVQQKDVDCYKGPLSGPAQSVYLSFPVIGFVGEAGDPPGRWIVRVTLKDKHRGVEVPLRTHFVLKDG
jgi:hypothetical protein